MRLEEVDVLVREFMSTPVVTVPPDASVAEAAALMVERRVGSVVVVDAEDPGRMVGIISQTDLELHEERVPFSYPEERAPRLLGRWAQDADQLAEALRRAPRRAVQEVMSAPVWTVGPDDEVWEALRRMVERDVRRLPVVEAGRLVGMMARPDLLKVIVRLAGEGPAED